MVSQLGRVPADAENRVQHSGSFTLLYCRRLRGGNFPESPSLRSGAVGDNGISGADGSRDGATNADGVISRDPGGNGAGADDANR